MAAVGRDLAVAAGVATLCRTARLASRELSCSTEAVLVAYSATSAYRRGSPRAPLGAKQLGVTHPLRMANRRALGQHAGERVTAEALEAIAGVQSRAGSGVHHRLLRWLVACPYQAVPLDNDLAPIA